MGVFADNSAQGYENTQKKESLINMFIITFIKDNWKFFTFVAVLAFLAIKGVTIQIDNSSHSDARSYSVSDASAYALNFTFIGKGNKVIDIPGVVQKTDVIPKCKSKTLFWCSEESAIDYKHYDNLAVFWYVFHDTQNYYVKYFVKEN